MTTFELLAAKIKKDIDVDAYNFKRIYAGYWQRRAGAWTWRASYNVDGREYILGSQYPAADLLKATKLVASKDNALDTDIFPD